MNHETMAQISKAHADGDEICLSIIQEPDVHIRVSVTPQNFADTLCTGRKVSAAVVRWRLERSRLAKESAALESSPVPTPENVTIRATRANKAQVARQALGTLQAAIQAEDWNSAQGSAELIAQMARWLKLSDESICENS